MPSNEAITFCGELMNWAASSTISERIKSAMDTNAQWEIWLQVELAIYLKSKSGLVVREQNYDASRKSLDILCKLNTRGYAIELKAESLKTGLTSGMTMVQALLSDKSKLEENPLVKTLISFGCNSLTSLVIGIGSISNHRQTALEILSETQAFILSFKDDFGLYILIME
ncbi:hypothetical protein M2D07_030695 [Pseudomonas sp. BGr12]|uniref:hypothetical protein n=1 Tax=unclassified Pseudomonas TaxID=196821 RepID=UPI00177DDA8B|nr:MULTISPECIES: hypothetical protein [unclassified Pseudomonas]MBD9504313.1 hypothetical protein [Pseudomonas sp. PDM17]MBD9579711.1 hypothetical protein [Pseudomonas sp. PDM23]MBD9673968.1 hypothetical protein [Pseudomonas sp. PDM21]MDL2431413.1 hypothetical protein [Pseudomonas sp. BJa5]